MASVNMGEQKAKGLTYSDRIDDIEESKFVTFIENAARGYTFKLNPIAFRMAKTELSFGHSDCNKVQ